MTTSAAADLGEPGVSHLVLSHIVTLIIASVTFFTYELVHFWHQKLVMAIRLGSNAFLWSCLIFRGPTTIFVVEFLRFHVQAVLEFLRDLSFPSRFFLRHVVESIFVVLILLLDTRFVHPGWLGALACLLLIAISVLNIRDHALFRSVIDIRINDCVNSLEMIFLAVHWTRLSCSVLRHRIAVAFVIAGIRQLCFHLGLEAGIKEYFCLRVDIILIVAGVLVFPRSLILTEIKEELQFRRITNGFEVSVR